MNKKIKKELERVKLILKSQNIFSSEIAFTSSLFDNLLYSKKDMQAAMEEHNKLIFDVRKKFIEESQITFLDKTILINKKHFLLKDKKKKIIFNEKWNNFEKSIYKILCNKQNVIFFDYFLIIPSDFTNGELTIEILNLDSGLEKIMEMIKFKNSKISKYSETNNELTQNLKLFNKESKNTKINKKSLSKE
ncbi:hypothetical protein MYMA111404_00050 [Mycoplasma marinum]|uniref:Uncharacterized protein n=1 Tax=Mycoplasma marinum TaxID=1937190 RepID=A0A4R0XLX6_9MOLU|nr:hypothetical protein [Mycoplasma marinum]TCG11696.1 hypothetical protein C4B24_00895 [Mycoplasma marinum]